MSIRSRVLLPILLAIPVFAQAPSAVPARQTARKATPAPQGLTVDGVLAMVEAGLSDDVVLARLRKEDKAFDLSPEDIIRVKKAKVSDAVLLVMMDPKAEIKPAVVPPAAPPAALLTPLPVVVQTPVFPGMAATKPSGATPGAGAAAQGDVNDPMTPHDSGIYLYTKDREGKPQMIVLERASYQGAKTGGVLASAMTYGIAKAKTKAVIPGARASIRISETAPVFYFYFEDKQAGLGKTYFGVGSLSNPNQFALLKLGVSKSNRETTVGEYSAWGSASGSDAKAMIPFRSERIRTGLYKVAVEGLKPGEYCFLSSTGNTAAAGPYGAYGAGAAVSADLFDFGVSIE
jgi:hypothetical protein